MEAEGAMSRVHCIIGDEEADCPLANAHPSKVVKWIMGMLAEGWRLAV